MFKNLKRLWNHERISLPSSQQCLKQPRELFTIALINLLVCMFCYPERWHPGHKLKVHSILSVVSQSFNKADWFKYVSSTLIKNYLTNLYVWCGKNIESPIYKFSLSNNLYNNQIYIFSMITLLTPQFIDNCFNYESGIWQRFGDFFLYQQILSKEGIIFMCHT